MASVVPYSEPGKLYGSGRVAVRGRAAIILKTHPRRIREKRRPARTCHMRSASRTPENGR